MENVIEKITSEFDAPEETVRTDALEFAEVLIEKNLLIGVEKDGKE